MSLISGIGDFFRGAFGEDAEEKKRRKQREAQEAAARKQQASKPRPQVAARPQAQAPRPNKVVQDVNKATQFNGLFQTQKPKPTAAPVTQAPRVEAPKPDQEFLGVTAKPGENKSILGWETPIKTVKTAVDRKVVTNTDKYVAQFDKFDPVIKKQVIKTAREKAAKGDQTAANTLKALTETGRLKLDAEAIIQRGADYAAAPGASVTRVATGAAQGISGLVDLFSPGKGTNRVSKALDRGAKNLDTFAKETDVNAAYKTGNVAGEIASFAIPTAAAEKIASKLGRTTKITDEVLSKVSKVVDNAGDAGKIRQALAEGMRRGLTVEESLQNVLSSSKYIGENASKGEKTTGTSVATDIATGVGGGVLFGGVSSLFGKGRRAQEAARLLEKDKPGGSALNQTIKDAEAEIKPAFQRGFGTAEPTAKEAYKAEQSAIRGENSTFKKMQELGLDPADENNIPAFQRNSETRDTFVKEAEDEIDQITKQLDQVPDRNIEEYKFNKQQQLAKDIAENPASKDALVKNYQRQIAAVDNLDNLKAYRAGLEERKQQLEKLVEDSNKIKARTDETIAKQAEANAQAVKAQEAAVADVQTQQAAQTAPAPGQIVQDTPVPGSPEVAANNAYGDSTVSDIINAGKPTFEEKGRLSIPQLFSPDRILRERATRKAEEAANKAAYALQTGDSRLGRFFGRTGTGFSRELGVTPEVQAARMQMRGGIELGKINNQSINDLADGLSKDELTDVFATINKTRAAELGKVVDPANLSPEQTALREKLMAIRDNTTSENLRRGFINVEQASDPNYLTNDYTFLYDQEGEVGKFEQGFRQELLGQYKGRKDVSEETIRAAITDPAYLVGKKRAQSEAAWAMQDYGNFLSRNGNISDVPKPGWSQLPDTALFGEAAGKFVPRNLAEDFTGFQYDMAMVSSFNDFITAYDRLGIRQGKKALLTVFNPAVRLGNQVTNRGIFSQLAGINPIQFNIAMEAAKNEIKAGGQLYREAVEQGLTGIDLTQADFFIKRISDSAPEDKNIAKKALDHLKTSYSGADDQARIAAYMVKRQQGYDPVEAARQVQRGFQDYKSVGFFYDMAAKVPFIGNAFVRFAADSVRIAKNAALDHPLRTAGTVAAWAAFVNGMSVISGESDLKGDNVASQAFNLVTGKGKSDAQKERENRFGSPKLPFSDISTAVQTPFGEINVARFMPWYQLADIPGANAVQRVLPFSKSPVDIKDGKLSINPQGFNDPLTGQLVQIGVDKDFRGKSIRDPQNNEADKFRRDPLSPEDQIKNVARFLFNNNAPVGREIDQTISAATGNPDMYGKDRSIWQALFRDAGLKIEQQGTKQAQDRASLNTYIENTKQIEEELKGMSPDAQEAWKRLTGFDKMREQVPNEFKPGETRNKKAEVYAFPEDKWRDYASHPELYNLMVENKQREAAAGKPIQPEFDSRLSDSFRKQIIQNKAVAPGDDAELDQRMYSSPEWDYYQNLKDEYKKKASQYYPQTGKENFDDETVAHDDEKFPTKPDLLKSYSAAYKLYTDGKRDKPQWNDQLTAEKEAYNKLTLDWTNKARAARGLPAITWDVWNNPTFGFDETPSSGSGFGFGFGGGGGGGANYVNTLTDLTHYGDSVKRLNPVEPAALPNLVAVFQKLMAGSGGGKVKPKLGASSKGQG